MAVLILGGIYYIVTHLGSLSGSHTIATTTISGNQAQTISSCTAIKNPGTYNLTANITTTNQSSACIQISSSSVVFNGNGHSIMGNGPYIFTPPYSYGVSLRSVSNVVIRHLTVSKFSYGIYLNNSYNNMLSNDTVSNMTLSGIYLAGSKNNIVTHDNVTGVNGPAGGVSLQNGGNNTVSYSAVKYNTLFGIMVNSTGNGFYNDNLVGNPTDMVCAPGTGYASYNKFANTSCYVYNYCHFATCSEQNLPATPQFTVLQSNVTECGQIISPGSYSLANDLNIPDYISSSLPLR